MYKRKTESKQKCALFQMAAASGDMRRALEASTAALELKVQEAVAEQADLEANALIASKTASHTACYFPFPAAAAMQDAMLAVPLLLLG